MNRAAIWSAGYLGSFWEAADRLNVSSNLTCACMRVCRNLSSAGVWSCFFSTKMAGRAFRETSRWFRALCGAALRSELARRRIAVGCNWMAIPGIEYPLNDSIKVNLARVFEVALYEMFDHGERSVARLQSLYEKHLKLCFA